MVFRVKHDNVVIECDTKEDLRVVLEALRLHSNSQARLRKKKQDDKPSAKKLRETDRCTGHCCVAFPLPYSPEQIRAMEERVTSPIAEDIDTIADMVYPLDWVPPPTDEAGHGVNQQFHYYGCKHLQENGDCAIYERRPRMCRGYPYGTPCPIEGCTYTGVGKDEESTEQPKDKEVRNEKNSTQDKHIKPVVQHDRGTSATPHNRYS